MASGKTKRFRVPVTSEARLTSPLIHKGRFTLYQSTQGRMDALYLHSGTPGSWTENTGLGGAYAYWPVVGVDSNDAVHISYHLSWTYKDVMYMTNASGSWSTPSKVEEYGGWGSVMVIDANDDIFIPNIHPSSGTYDDELQLTTVQGSGQGLTARPIFDISPMLPDGLVMNWRNGTIGYADGSLGQHIVHGDRNGARCDHLRILHPLHHRCTGHHRLQRPSSEQPDRYHAGHGLAQQ